jgi:hypothetical protein
MIPATAGPAVARRPSSDPIAFKIVIELDQGHGPTAD